MNHYIDTGAVDLARSRTVGLTQLTPEPFPVLAVPSKSAHTFMFANRGALESFSGNANYTLKVTLAEDVGELDISFGTFALGVNSNWYALPADIDAAGLAKILNDDGAVSAAGGVNVAAQGVGRFMIAGSTVGAAPTYTPNAALAFPDCISNVSTLEAGNATIRQLTMLTIRRALPVQSTNFTNVTSPNNGWAGFLDLTSAAARELVRIRGEIEGGVLECDALLNVEVIDATNSNASTVFAQLPVTLRAQNYD